MVLYRPHRGMLADAMKEVAEVADFAALVAHMRGEYPFYPEDQLPTESTVTVEKYGTGIDERIGWDTHIVLVNGQAWGFTNGMVEAQEAATDSDATGRHEAGPS